MSITINARDARLSILGYQPEVKSIYWSHLPTNLPTYGQPLDLTGSEITAVYVNGEEAVVTEYCTFSPDQGAVVPNEPTMTVTAVYTARSGKIVKADALLPIANPSFIRVVVPLEVRPTKPWSFFTRLAGVDTGIDWLEAWGWSEIKTYLFWTRLDEVVKIQEVEPVYTRPRDYFYVGGIGYDPPNTIAIGILDAEDATYNQYYTPTQFREVTNGRAIKIHAEYEIYGITLVDEPYLEIDEVDRIELIDAPTSCPEDSTTTYTLTGANTRTVFKGGDRIDNWHLPYQNNYPRYQPGAGYYDALDITIGRDYDSTFSLIFPSPGTPVINDYSYSCSNGRVTWSDPNENN